MDHGKESVESKRVISLAQSTKGYDPVDFHSGWILLDLAMGSWCVLTNLPRTIALTGATGYIGGRLVGRLLDAGHRVRCLTRSPRKLSARDWFRHSFLEICEVDIANRESLQRCLAGCDSTYYLVHSMETGGDKYAARDRTLAEAFASACRLANVQRIIYLGGLGEMGKALSQHLRSRREVEEILQNSGVPVTVLRAAMIIGSGSASFEILRYLVERLPVMITPKWVKTPCQPIAIRNAIHYLAEVLNVPSTTGEVFDIGGSDVLKYRDIMQVMAEELKLSRRWIIPVPVLTPRLSSYWIHLVTPLNHSIARPLAEGLKNPVTCRDSQIAQLIPQKLLSVREAIRIALTKIEAQEVETSWSMAGPIPGDPEWAGGKTFRDRREVNLSSPDWAVFRAVCRLGGKNGWYSRAWMWRLRGWLDRLAGGPGIRRGRRDQELVSYGEAIDFWRVADIHPSKRLALRSEMRMPGEAMLEFCIDPIGPDQSRLVQTAWFQPKGLLGLVYWWLVSPFHAVVFKSMLRGIERTADEIARKR